MKKWVVGISACWLPRDEGRAEFCADGAIYGIMSA